MFIKGVSKRSSGEFQPQGSKEKVSYDFYKLHCEYTPEDLEDMEIPEMLCGSAVEIVKVPYLVFKKFLDSTGMNPVDIKGLNVSFNYNKFGKISSMCLM